MEVLMLIRTLVGVAASALLTVGSVQAAIVDADTRNGDFEFNDEGNAIQKGGWSLAVANAQDWFSPNPVNGNDPYTVTGTPMIYYTTNVVNNTGVTLDTGTIYSIDANAEAVIDATPVGPLVNGAFIDLIATENSDGTGTTAVIAPRRWSPARRPAPITALRRR
jgi:hypothetical protein